METIASNKAAYSPNMYFQLSSEEQAPSANAKKAIKMLRPERLAQAAAKKGVVEDRSKFAKKTRQGQELKPEEQRLKTFSKNNFTAAKTMDQVRFQLQEMAKFTMAHLEKMNFTTREKSSLVAFLLKQFQKGNLTYNQTNL